MENNTIPNPHLVLFQIMGKTLRGDPTAVIAELSGWLSNPDSPALWAPFAFSIRGLAYEVMDECDLARMDYIQGLNLYDTLLEELGEEVLQRMTNNMKFMRVRLEALPPAAVSPVESYFEKYAAEAVYNNDMKEFSSIHDDVPEPPAEEHAVGEESVYQWEHHDEEHHERSDKPETLNQQEQVWENWEDDVNMETVAVDVKNKTGVEGHSGEDSADHAQEEHEEEHEEEEEEEEEQEEEHEEENTAVNGEMAIQITEVQNLEETTSGNVAEEVDVLNILSAGPEVIDVNVDGTQETLDDHGDETTGEQQVAEVDSKTGVGPAAEPQHQATD